MTDRTPSVLTPCAPATSSSRGACQPPPSGARRGELLGLTWGDVDWSGARLHIRRSWSLATASAGPTKGGDPRAVPVGREVLGRLREHRLRAGRPGPDVRVVGFDPRKPFARVVAAAQLDDPQPTPQSLRHTTATWWLSVHEVAELLGHRDASLVLRLYGHALPARRATAGERLERFLADA